MNVTSSTIAGIPPSRTMPPHSYLPVYLRSRSICCTIAWPHGLPLRVLRPRRANSRAIAFMDMRSSLSAKASRTHAACASSTSYSSSPFLRYPKMRTPLVLHLRALPSMPRLVRIAVFLDSQAASPSSSFS